MGVFLNQGKGKPLIVPFRSGRLVLHLCLCPLFISNQVAAVFDLNDSRIVGSVIVLFIPEEGELVLEVAARELLEETGYTSAELEFIQTVYEYPSKADHVIHIVRAKNAYKSSDVKHEETESISPVHLITANMEDYGGIFDTTYNITALALTLPNFLKQ